MYGTVAKYMCIYWMQGRCLLEWEAVMLMMLTWPSALHMVRSRVGLSYQACSVANCWQRPLRYYEWVCYYSVYTLWVKKDTLLVSITLRNFRVSPDMICSNLAGVGFGRIWNCRSGRGRGRMFFELWAYVT